MNVEDLRKEFEKEKGIPTINSQGEPDIDYVDWLEQKLLPVKSAEGKNPQQVLDEIWTVINEGLESEILLSGNQQDKIEKILIEFRNQSPVDKGVSDSEIERMAEELYNGHPTAMDWQLEKRGFKEGIRKGLSLCKGEVNFKSLK